MLKHIHPKTQGEFFERIFWKDNKKKPSMAPEAMKIYQMIKDGSFNKKTREYIMGQLGISFGQYYYVLSMLKALGLVRKEYGEYKTSKDFVKRLERLIEFAET